jgi:hypothetical protein
VPLEKRLPQNAGGHATHGQAKPLTIDSMRRTIPEVLRQQWDVVAKQAASLSEEQFHTPTRCHPWDIKALLAHMWRALFRIPTALEAPEPPEARVDSVAYWTSYDPKTDAPQIAQHATKSAEDYRTGRDLAEDSMSSRLNASL